jgi:hypothetical protein
VVFRPEARDADPEAISRHPTSELTSLGSEHIASVNAPRRKCLGIGRGTGRLSWVRVRVGWKQHGEF